MTPEAPHPRDPPAVSFLQVPAMPTSPGQNSAGRISTIDPTNKDECKNGGWEAFAFRNQEQCIRFVNTGKDSA